MSKLKRLAALTRPYYFSSISLWYRVSQNITIQKYTTKNPLVDTRYFENDNTVKKIQPSHSKTVQHPMAHLEISNIARDNSL